MRIFNRAHFPWFVFVIVASVFATWLYVGNFASQNLPAAMRLPPSLTQRTFDYRSAGGTPIGLVFGSIAFGIFIFAGLLGVRKKVVLWRLGTLQRWMRAHIWLTLLTIPLVLFHCGFRLGGPMTTLLIVLYAIVMISGVYGLALQHQLPHTMKERLPAETVYEQIPHIRAQLVAAAEKIRDSFQPAPPPQKADAGAPAPSPDKAVTAGSTPMASTTAELSTPTARAKSVVGSAITAEPVTVGIPGGASGAAAPPAASESSSPATAAVPSAPPAKPEPVVSDPGPASEAVLHEFIELQILPYLSAKRGDRYRLGNSRYAEDFFRLIKLRVPEAYRQRVEEIQGWCDERRMLDLQLKLHHWLHGWLFVHVPISFLLILLTGWHAWVALFYY